MSTMQEQLIEQLNHAYLLFSFETNIAKKVKYKQAITLIQTVLDKINRRLI